MHSYFIPSVQCRTSLINTARRNHRDTRLSVLLQRRRRKKTHTVPSLHSLVIGMMENKEEEKKKERKTNALSVYT